MAKKPKQIPAGPFALIAQTISGFGLTQDEAATALGVSRLTVSELVNGKRALTAGMALRFERALGVDAEGLLMMQMRHDLAIVRQDAAFMAELAKIKPLRK